MTEKKQISRIEAKNYRFVAGIDPGVSTGLAIQNRKTKALVTADTRDFWQAYNYFARLSDSMRAQFLVVIETPDAKRAAYARLDKWDKGDRYREKITANIGANRREAQLLADGIEALGYTVRRVTPSRTKWTAADLKRYTGLDIRVSQHVRDAIALCWGV